jgi:hypothetical protein
VAVHAALPTLYVPDIASVLVTGLTCGGQT